MESKVEVRFEIPVVGLFKIYTNPFKYSAPFPHYNEQEKEEHIRGRKKMKEYVVWYNGGGIGGVNKIEDGYKVIKEYAEEYLRLEKSRLKEGLKKVLKVIKTTKESDWIQLFKKESKPVMKYGDALHEYLGYYGQRK